MKNRLYYKEKLIVQIGEEIKLTRKANNGIYKQIMNTI